MIPNAHEFLTAGARFNKKFYKKYKKSGYRLYNASRVTTVGRFVRKHSIDEIPQLINVLRGEMSLVGPRPYYPDELVEQQKKFPHTRHLVDEVLSVRPGVTGAWQVSERSDVNFDKRIAMDADYARRKSILYDIIILLKSPWAMISGKGAV
ncbi:MAG: sugar transferase [Patescibacteria group bacterium]